MSEGNSWWKTFRQCSDITRRTILKQMLAEFLGVTMLVLVAVGSHLATADPERDSVASSVHVPLAVGLAVASMILCMHHVSGGHINPAVSCALLALGKMSFLRTVLYIIAQCLGGVCGSVLLYAMLPFDSPPKAHSLNEQIHPIQGFGIEFFVTFILLLTILASVDPNRTDIGSNSMPLAVGLAVVANCLFAGHWTSASMNPAVSFGLSAVANLWKDHWVYWLGPCLGGIAAATLYWAAFQAEEPSPSRTPTQNPVQEMLLSDSTFKESVSKKDEAMA